MKTWIVVVFALAALLVIIYSVSNDKQPIQQVYHTTPEKIPLAPALSDNKSTDVKPTFEDKSDNGLGLKHAALTTHPAQIEINDGATEALRRGRDAIGGFKDTNAVAPEDEVAQPYHAVSMSEEAQRIAAPETGNELMPDGDAIPMESLSIQNNQGPEDTSY